MLNVVLYQPEIPPNTGNIGRLCHAVDATLHLVEPLGFSLDEKSLKRAGLDYWDELSPQIWNSWQDLTKTIPSEASVFFLTTKAKQSYWDVKFRRGDYLVFGPETRGLPESFLDLHFDTCLTIPQKQGRSLNLATAAGIVLYEGIRQLSAAPTELD
ncbi:MAG: tRNA (cytidine(34)-2'-O)-methyltransferase [Verrucomicrobiota bacterium]